MLDEAQLGEYIEQHFKSKLFRLETLARYHTSSEDADFRRYLSGQPGPTSTWPEVIRSEVAQGLHTYRVHVVRSPLSDYLRYEFEWAYTANAAAGEEIYIIDTTERAKPEILPDQDFWLIGDEHLVLMHYDSNGTFRGASIGAPDLIPRYVAARDAALSAGEAFTDYWRRHPRYHRDRSAA